MDLSIGSTVGDYQVVGILGAGGMGQVYKVRNVISDRVEAMKVLLPDLIHQADLADRFLREIKVQAGLDHPNIAQLRTALRVENQLFMLMEFVEGETLEHKLAGGPLPPAAAVDYIMQALAALDYAHARGVVHRDVKPANMIVTGAGVLKLMDFGIAKVASDHRLTMTGTTLGSLYYMSPEQIQGAANLDGRSDLYSVGVALYELVTGKRPFNGTSQFSIMQAHLTSSPAPPIQIDPKLPKSLNDVILASVKREAGERFQSAAAFRQALSAVVVELEGRPGKPVVAAPAPEPAAPQPEITPVIAMAKPPGKFRGIWLGIGALAAVMTIVAVIQFGPRKTTKAAPAMVTAPAPALPVPVDAPQSQTQPDVKPAPPRQVQSQAQAAPVAPKAAARKTPVGQVTSPKAQAVSPPSSTPAFVPPAPAQAPAQASAPPAQTPPPVRAAEGPSPAELQQTREQIAMLGVRAGGIRGSLESMQRSQAASGLNLRHDMQEAASLMTGYLDAAAAALKAGDVAQAKIFAQKAERQIEKLEKFLNH